MKKLIFIPVLLAVLFQTSAKLIILLSFHANQEYISRNLCEKKEIKNNDCKGHCCLKKQLEKQEKSESPLQSQLKEKSEVQYCALHQANDFKQYGSFVAHHTPFKITWPAVIISAPFHPPC